MTLPVSTTSPIRTPSRYRELVEAVLRAPAFEQETNALEWKSEANLAEKRWQAAIGRQVLGSANRDPEAAGKLFGGCGYILVGVRPGQLAGTTAHDAAKVEEWLSAYVGRAPEAPEWAPTYVEIEGKQVLVLTVEAPKLGDPIWTCQREYRAGGDDEAGRERVVTRKGAIYVRRQASTVEAGPEEIAMLSRRLIAAPRRVDGLSVTLVPDSIAQPVDFSDEQLGVWLAAERAALEPPPPMPMAMTDEELTAQVELDKAQETVGEANRGSDGDDQGDRADEDEYGEDAKPEGGRATTAPGATIADLTRGLGGGLKLGDLLKSLANAQASALYSAASAASFLYEPDSPTREQYEEEVERYLTKAGKRLIATCTRRLYDRRMGRVQVAITNETDDPMQDVRLELHVAGSVVALYDDEIPEAKLPSRPVMLGQQVRERYSALSGLNTFAYPSLNIPRYDTPGLRAIGRRISIDNSGSARITFNVGNLYPRERDVLDEFYLFVRQPMGTIPPMSLTATWEAVTRNLSGVQHGSLEIPVAGTIPTVSELLAEQPGEGEDGQEDEGDPDDD